MSRLDAFPGLLRNVCAFLGAEDALSLDACGSSTRCVVASGAALSTTAADGAKNADPSRSWRAGVQDYDPAPWLSLGSFDADTHTVRLEFRWADQGYGNSKGMISIVRGDGRPPREYQAWDPCVVCGREPAPHKGAADFLEFCPIAGETYTLWVRVGGGGGHSLYVGLLGQLTLKYRLEDNMEVSPQPGGPEVEEIFYDEV
mmetsp:Transcript_14086/g.41980  ORF Transcript_14086/g.41980 Transcript_14086/m.41980 type:complete len:201 (+) Transcript_14086:267-869(+)